MVLITHLSVEQRHSLTVQPRKKLSSHIDYELARQCFSKHFEKGLSFSTTPLEVSFSSRSILGETLEADHCDLGIDVGRRSVPQEGYSGRIGPPSFVSAPSDRRGNAQDD